MDKEVKYINLESTQMSPDEVLLAKIDIESNLDYEQRATLVDFMTNLGITNVYVFKKQMISFSIKEGNNKNYVFYAKLQTFAQNEEGKKLQNELFGKFKSKLSQIGYDLSKLSKKTNDEIVERGYDILELGEYFIIDNSFYI